MNIKHAFSAGLAVLCLNVWANDASKRPKPWHAQPENQNDSCALVFASTSTFIADLIEIPDEAEFNKEVSIWANGDLDDFFTHGPAKGLNWEKAGLSFEMTQRGFHLLKNGVEIKHFNFNEPIADIRFISDEQVYGGLEGQGYLSIVGWSEVRFFRIEIIRGEGYLLTAMDRDTYASAVGHLSPASASNTGLYDGVDNGLLGSSERPTSLNVPALPSIMGQDESGIQEYLELTHLDHQQRTPSVLRYALGALGELILENLKRVSQGQKAVWSVPKYPTILLRLAAKALIRDPALRADLAYLMMVKDKNDSPKSTNLEELESAMTQMNLADFSIEATDYSSKKMAGIAKMPAFTAIDRSSNQPWQIEISISPLATKDFIQIKP